MVIKFCHNCALKIKNKCDGNTNDKFCDNWLPKAANCRLCLSLRQCLSKKVIGVSESNICKKFSRNKFPPDTITTVENELSGLEDYQQLVEDNDLFSPVDLIEKIISSDFDSRAFSLVDDSDIPRPENEVDFVLNPEFLNIELFARQLVVVMELFGCYCPYCSDVKFIKKRVEVDTPLDEILDRAVLYNAKGICPKCKRSKYDAWKDEKLKRYDQLIGICGQRSGKCLHPNTIVPTEHGLLHLKELDNKAPYDFSDIDLKVAIENGDLVNATKFYKQKPQKLLQIHLKNGYEIVGAKTHPIMLKQGWTKLPDVKVGDSVPIYYGQNVWGTQLPNFEDSCGEYKSKIDNIISGDNSAITDENIRNVFTLLGYYISEDSSKCEEQTIPNIVRQSPKEYVILFLKSFFEKGGYFNHNTLQYNTVSKILSNQLSAILHNIGIIHRIAYKIDKESESQVSKPSYHIYIEGNQLELFEKEIGFVSKRKQDRLSRTINRYKSRTLNMPFWYEKCPDWMKDDFQSTLKEVNRQLRQHPHPIYKNIKCGLRTVFGVKGLDMLRRMGAHNVPLTKHKILYLTEPLLDAKYVPLLSKDIVNKLIEFYSFAKSKMYYSEVVSVIKTKNRIRTYDFHIPLVHRFMSNGILSHNSVLTAIISAVLTMRYLTIPDLIDILPGMLQKTFHGTFVALTYSQAFDTLWQPYYDLITSAPWFKMYLDFLSDYEQEIGKELFKIRDSFVAFKHCGVVVYPSGPDKRKLRGKTRFLASCDEFAWFYGTDASIKYNPHEIYAALDNSLMTIRSGSRRAFERHPYIPTAYGLYITSPASKTDKAMQMYNQSKTSKKILGFHYPTWDFNPNITKEDLADQFKSNPVNAERDFGANPPHSTNPFISNITSLVNMFSSRTRNVFRLKTSEIVKDSLDNYLISPTMKIRRTHTFPSILTIDTGFSNNSFACALMHIDQETGFIVTTGLVEIIPDPYPISYVDTYHNIIAPIIANFSVKLVAFDQWQSINLSQQIYSDFEIDTIRYSLTYDDFEDIRAKVYAEELDFPRLEHDYDKLIRMETDLESLVKDSPVSHLFLQFLLVNDTGRTVTKGDEGTDDLFRAFSLGHALLTHEDFMYLFDGDGSYNGKYIPTSHMISVSLKSRGQTTAQSASSSGIVLVNSIRPGGSGGRPR